MNPAVATDSSPVVIALCGFSLVCLGLIAVGAFLAIRLTGGAFFQPLMALFGQAAGALSGGDDGDEGSDRSLPRRGQRAAKPQTFEAQAQSLDFDQAVARYRQQSGGFTAPPPGANTAPPSPAAGPVVPGAGLNAGSPIDNRPGDQFGASRLPRSTPPGVVPPAVNPPPPAPSPFGQQSAPPNRSAAPPANFTPPPAPPTRPSPNRGAPPAPPASGSGFNTASAPPPSLRSNRPRTRGESDHDMDDDLLG